MAPHGNFKRSLASVILPLVLMFPPTPIASIPDDAQEYRLEPFDDTQHRKTWETFTIVAILQSANVNLGQVSDWNFAETLWEESSRYDLDPLMVLALINVESRFLANAVSKEGAHGLMQILPWVAGNLVKEAALEHWQGTESLFDPIFNIKLGVYYLGYLHDRFGDIRIALTAYNQGPTRVQRKLDRQKTLSWRYADRILAITQLYRTTALQAQRSETPQSPSMKS